MTYLKKNNFTKTLKGHIRSHKFKGRIVKNGEIIDYKYAEYFELEKIGKWKF